LVEGFFDVISLTKLGVENCVAILGTSLSEEQIKLLVNLKKRIILFLDGDKAGKEATISVSTKLLLHEIDCEIVKHNYKEDPDEICRQQDKESIQVILKKRENPYLFILQYYFNNWEIEENPQRVNYFIQEMAKIFQNFKINIHSFLVEKISLMVK
jgi:DNA primase